MWSGFYVNEDVTSMSMLYDGSDAWLNEYMTHDDFLTMVNYTIYDDVVRHKREH
jgi:hypothetical protein